MLGVGGAQGVLQWGCPPQHPSCLLVLPQSPAGLLGILPSEAAWPHGADFQQGFFLQGFLRACVPEEIPANNSPVLWPKSVPVAVSRSMLC